MATEAPFSRSIVDETLPWLRAALGVCFVAFSAGSTIQLAGGHLLWLFEGTKQITIGAFPDAYWYSTALAVILFVGEVWSSERYPKTYRLFLIPDTFYTGLGIFAGLAKAITTLLLAALIAMGVELQTATPIADVLGWLLAFPAAAYVGYLIAKWGEVLLFGKRRKPRGTRKED